MAKQFKKTGQNLFCSDFVVEQALAHVPQFLRRLDRKIDFEGLWQDKLLAAYKGGAEIGPPPYPPAMMLKMLFLAYLFNVSERETERLANDRISFKVFLGLGLMDKAPDHSSLTKFKNRILKYQEYQGCDIFREIFDDIIIFAQARGIKLGFVQAIDSTHTIADVNRRKEKRRTKPPGEGGDGKKPRDPDAKTAVKRTKTSTTVDGRKVRVHQYYFGYKSHISANTDMNIATSYRVTPFNVYDGHLFKPLMDDDIAKGVTTKMKTTYTADKAYDNGDNHVWLQQAELFDAITLNLVKEKDKTKEGKPLVRWKALTTQETFEEGLSQRYAVERVNASLKKDHGLGRARYLGLAKMKAQTAMTCMAHNLKTLVKFWTGVGLRTMSTAHVSSAV